MTDSDSQTALTTPGLLAPRRALRALTALQRTLDEVNHMPVDEATRRRLVELHRATLIELASAISGTLVDELVRLHVRPLEPEASVSQLKVAQAQLLGWVNGLFESGGEVRGQPVAIRPRFGDGSVLVLPAPGEETDLG